MQCKLHDLLVLAEALHLTERFCKSLDKKSQRCDFLDQLEVNTRKFQKS